MKIFLLFASVFIAPVFETQAQAQPAPNDHQIAAIITAAHTLDIESGELAQFKSSSAEVQFFGQRMVADHTMELARAKREVLRAPGNPQAEHSALQQNPHVVSKLGADRPQRDFRTAHLPMSNVNPSLRYPQTAVKLPVSSLFPLPIVNETITGSFPGCAVGISLPIAVSSPEAGSLNTVALAA
jgi:hypothetical protein